MTGKVELLTPLGGKVILDPTNTAVDRTLTLPARAGNVAVDGPAFRAFASTATNMANSVKTKMVFVTENFDTDSCYDTGLSRFTPNVAGVYLFNAAHYVPSAELGGYYHITIFKNGVEISSSLISTASGIYKQNVTAIIDANGTTDYFEVYGEQSSGATRNSATDNDYYFAGSFLRPL